MSEASRARVTITLGRTGQVVKRPVSDVGFCDSLRGAGSKRFVRDRLGSNLDSSQVYNKRQRGDGYISILGANGIDGIDGIDDVRIGKNDLRLKLMQKNVVRQAQSDDNRKFMDLRQKLLRTGHPPHSSLDTRQHVPELKETSLLGRIPVTRSTNDLPQLNSSRRSYSDWTLDNIRRRSPERIVGSSRGLSPTRNVDLQRRTLSRTYDDVRAVSYMSKDVHIAPSSMSTPLYMAKSTLSPGSVKPVPPGPPLLGQLLPPTAIVQKSLYPGEEQQTVDGLLHSLGLGKYAILFKAEEVDMTALKQMGENDLKELGIPMGPRKKILALLFCSKR